MFSRIQSKLQARGYWAEALPAETTTGVAGNSAVDRIAELLSGTTEEPAKKEPTKKVIEESEEADTRPDDSNQDADEVETEVEESDEPAQADDDDEDVTWAKTLGVDEKTVVLDDDGNLAGINVKVNGKVSIVEVKDLIAGYQNNKSNTEKSKAIADERREFDAIKGAVAAEYTKKIETVERLTKHLKDTLVGEYSQVDWTRLRAENPGEYAAAIQDFNLRNAEIEKISNAVNEEKAVTANQMTAEQQQHFNAYIKGEAEKIITNNPTWVKPEVFKRSMSELATFVEEAYGFNDAEFKNIQDARILEVLKDAMKYRNGMKVAKEKLEVKVPKFQKSTGNATKALTKLDRLTKKAKTSTGYAKRNAETDAVAELLGSIL
jgi:hypothetical protein